MNTCLVGIKLCYSIIYILWVFFNSLLLIFVY